MPSPWSKPKGLKDRVGELVRFDYKTNAYVVKFTDDYKVDESYLIEKEEQGGPDVEMGWWWWW